MKKKLFDKKKKENLMWKTPSWLRAYKKLFPKMKWEIPKAHRLTEFLYRCLAIWCTLCHRVPETNHMKIYFHNRNKNTWKYSD
jgi:formate hydrogenlyase subunit 6/NADH:ubiquinone oxidoreductase subunit I